MSKYILKSLKKSATFDNMKIPDLKIYLLRSAGQLMKGYFKSNKLQLIKLKVLQWRFNIEEFCPNKQNLER